MKTLMRALEAHLDGGQPMRLPDGAGIIWDAFVALSRTRTAPQAISYRDVQAYCDLMRVPLEPHHVRTIMELDDIWLSWATKPQKPEKPLPKLSVAAFDARITGKG